MRIKASGILVILLVGMLFIVCVIHVDAPSGSCDLKSALTNYGTSLGTAENLTLAQTLQSISQGVDWSKAVYAGVLFNNKTKTDLETLIDNYAASGDWMSVFLWTATCKKLGIERENAIKAALDGLSMVGPLPWTIKYGGIDYFCVERKSALLGYYYAEKYNYRLDKWNKTDGYGFFSAAIKKVGNPVLFIDANGSTWRISYGPRYYDESACTVQCFLLFFEMGIGEALNDALYWWDWINNNLWYQDTHYKYALGWANYECEAGFFAKIIANLKSCKSDLGNWSRVLLDLENRFLLDKWDSKQWLDGNRTTYVVVHHYPDNRQRRLYNTFGAWTSLLEFYLDLSSASENSVRDLMMGYDDLDPAWKLLMSPFSNLYDNSTKKFRGASDGLFSDEATAYALTLMFFFGVVPKTTTLAFPLEDYSYEYMYDIDPELYSINLQNNSLRISVVDGGELEFAYGATPVLCNFSSSGVYELTFSSDWNSMVNITKIQNLPTNRKFLPIIMHTEPDVGVSNVMCCKNVVGRGFDLSIRVDVQNHGSSAETFNVTLYTNTTAIGMQPVMLAGGDSASVSFVWNTSGFSEGNYTINAYAWPLPSESSTADNRFTDGWVIVSAGGDINGDKAVDIIDAILLSMSFHSQPVGSDWNPNADINGDEIVDVLDALILADSFGREIS